MIKQRIMRSPPQAGSGRSGDIEIFRLQRQDWEPAGGGAGKHRPKEQIHAHGARPGRI